MLRPLFASWLLGLTLPALAAGAPNAAELKWQGTAGFPRAVGGPALAVVAKDDLIEFTPAQASRPAQVQRVRHHRTVVWTRPLPETHGDAAALLVAGGAVYVACYSPISSGATVHAFDLKTGAPRWSTELRGLGPIDHSKYANQVVLRGAGGALAAFGNEAAGRYIEVLDPTTGKTLSNRVLPQDPRARR